MTRVDSAALLLPICGDQLAINDLRLFSTYANDDRLCFAAIELFAFLRCMLTFRHLASTLMLISPNLTFFCHAYLRTECLVYLPPGPKHQSS